MTDAPADPSSPAPRTEARSVTGRRFVVGVVVAVVAAGLAILFGLGAWNPWRLVALQGYLGQPLLGGFVVGVGAYLALWLLAPVRDEALQRWRLRVRVAVAVLAVLALISHGLLGALFRADVQELARSADGEWAVAAVTPSDPGRTTELRLWRGAGLAAREVGSFGRLCGGLSSIGFPGPGMVELVGSYGTWRLEFDPATGVPRQVLGPRCPDGPIPATLGR